MLEQEHPRDAVRVAPHIVHRRLVELSRQTVDRLVGVLVGGPHAAPLEELDQRAPQPFVLDRGPLVVRTEPCKQASEIGRCDRSTVAVPRRAHLRTAPIVPTASSRDCRNPTYLLMTN